MAEITDELEHYGAKTVPNQRDLDTFCQQLNEALDQDFDIRKTALHTLIRKIEVDEDGQLDFDFYLASDVLASTPTAVPPLWGYHIAIAKYGSTPHHPEGYSLSSSRSRGNYGLRRGERNRPLGQSESLIQLVVSFQVKYG